MPEIWVCGRIVDEDVYLTEPASMTLGAAQRAFNLALDFTKTRMVGFIPLYEHILVVVMLFDMQTKAHASYLLWQRATWSI